MKKALFWSGLVFLAIFIAEDWVFNIETIPPLVDVVSLFGGSLCLIGAAFLEAIGWHRKRRQQKHLDRVMDADPRSAARPDPPAWARELVDNHESYRRSH